MFKTFLICLLMVWSLLPFGGGFAHAGKNEGSPAILGSLGLNTIPSARMDKAGTARASVSALDPYMHSALGFQFTDALYISLRQTTEAPSLHDRATAFHPGVDIRLCLHRESALTPAVALGIQSAIGHQRMAGEYLTFSKRYKSFDFSAGIGWWRNGDAAHLDNPLKVFGNHFNKPRDRNTNSSNSPSNWFSSDSIGFFGGFEYNLPINGLNLKLDYSTDRYKAEKTDAGFKAPAPWGIGLSYSPAPWINAGIGIQGTDKTWHKFPCNPESIDGHSGHQKRTKNTATPNGT